MRRTIVVKRGKWFRTRLLSSIVWEIIKDTVCTPSETTELEVIIR